MCGRYTQTAAFDELAQGFGTILENAGPEDLTARSNQFPSQNVPIIVVSKGVQQLVLVIILCTGISLGACAQMPPTTMQGSHEIEGRIVDVRGERMMLHDGTVPLVPGKRGEMVGAVAWSRGPGPVRREGWPEGCDGDGLQGRGRRAARHVAHVLSSPAHDARLAR